MGKKSMELGHLLISKMSTRRSIYIIYLFIIIIIIIIILKDLLDGIS
jgi:hypothetical protein